jgi:Protein of unknown function (DUF1670)
MKKTDYVMRKFAPQKRRTLKNILIQRIYEAFPRIGGKEIQELCASLILETVEENTAQRQALTHGQVLWVAVDKDSYPARRHDRLKTVILNLSTTDDIEGILNRKKQTEITIDRCIRLCREAYSQGALLSNSDLSLLLSLNDSRVSSLLTEWERKNKQIVPRRTTLHDLGSGVTHKKIICWKYYGEGKSSQQVAEETYHSIEAVDRYIGQFDRIRHLREKSMDMVESAMALGCGMSLVAQYWEIDNLLKGENDG